MHNLPHPIIPVFRACELLFSGGRLQSRFSPLSLMVWERGRG